MRVLLAFDKFKHALGARVALLAMACLPFQLHADSVAPPHSYTTTTPDGRYLFVMLAPQSPEADAARWREPFASKIRAIREKYAQSGLYKNDGSTTPLWTVNWYAYGVEPLSDGVHLIRHGPWATSGDTEALSFFANGTLVREYKVRDLVAFPWLMPHSVSHFSWVDFIETNDAAKTVDLTTLHWEFYTFDATTGKILSANKPMHWGAGMLVLLVGVWWGCRRLRATKKTPK